MVRFASIALLSVALGCARAEPSSPAGEDAPAQGLGAPSLADGGLADGAGALRNARRAASADRPPSALHVVPTSLAIAWNPTAAGLSDACWGVTGISFGRDGYEGAAAVEVVGLPEGMTAEAASFPPRESWLTLRVTQAVDDWLVGQYQCSDFLSTNATVRITTARGDVIEAPLSVTRGDVSRRFGNLDATYGPKGYRVAASLTGTAAGIVAVGGGRVVVLTSACELARYSLDAVLDPTFGTNGVSSLPLTRCGEVAALADGRLVVQGSLSDGRERFVGLSNDGGVDTSFGVAGWLVLQPNDLSTRDRQGRFLVASADPAATGPVALRRYDPHGQLDPTLASLTIPAGSVQALAADDAGFFAVSRRWTGTEFVVRRASWSGLADTTFGTNGEIVVPGDFVDFARVLASGELVIATSTTADRRSIEGSLFRFAPPAGGAAGASWTAAKVLTGEPWTSVVEEPGGTLLAASHGLGGRDEASFGALVRVTGDVMVFGPGLLAYQGGPFVQMGDGTALAACRDYWSDRIVIDRLLVP